MAEAVRRTPYELAFVDGAHEDALDAIAAEAEARDVDAGDPERFLLLENAGILLRDLRPESEAPASIARYGALLYHAFHFRREGLPLFVLDEHALRSLLETPRTVGAWRLHGPARAGYVQLPRNLLWAPAGQDGAAEPVDGFFWTFASAQPGAAARLLLALILGMRPNREGFGIIETAADVPGEPAAHWADIRARDEGDDFANILPGGDIQRLFALTSFGEALRLASLVLHAATDGGGVGDEERESAAASASPHVLPPTGIAFRRILVRADG
jgi:hypothetical protein